MELILTIDHQEVVEALIGELQLGGVGVVDSIEELLRRSFEDAVHSELGSVLVKPARVKVHAIYNKDRFVTMKQVAASGFTTWYPEIRFATSLENSVALENVELIGADLGKIRYGGGVERSFRYTQKELKTQINHTIRLNKVSLPREIFVEVAKRIEATPPEQPLIANLTAGPAIEGFRVITFDHVVNGEKVRCGCHILAHEVMKREASELASSYVSGAWPHQVLKLFELPVADAICHLCVARSQGPEMLADWYGRAVEENKGPYIDLLVKGEGLDKRTARAEVDRRLGLSKWTREAELHRQILKLFPGQRVRREASPRWLGRQRLDIYLPDIQLAIEHQGEQHFRPISHFGGADAHQKVVERDRRKRDLCRQNGVALVEVRHDESLSRAHLRSRLRRWLGE